MPRRRAGMPMRRKLLVTEPTHVDRSWCGGGLPKQLVWWSNAKADGVLEGCHSPCPVTRGPLSGHQSISVRSPGVLCPVTRGPPSCHQRTCVWPPENLCLVTRGPLSGQQRTSVLSPEDLRAVTREPVSGHQRTSVRSPEDLRPVTRGSLSGQQKTSVRSTEELCPVTMVCWRDAQAHGVLEGRQSSGHGGGMPKPVASWRDARAHGVLDRSGRRKITQKRTTISQSSRGGAAKK